MIKVYSAYNSNFQILKLIFFNIYTVYTIYTLFISIVSSSSSSSSNGSSTLHLPMLYIKPPMLLLNNPVYFHPSNILYNNTNTLF